MPDQPTTRFNPEAQSLWDHVTHRWNLARDHDAAAIRPLLHPASVGWDMNSPLPHDREAAVQSVAGDSPRVIEHTLKPLSVRVYDHSVGVAHDTYTATRGAEGSGARQITGKWSEVYLGRNGTWLMISVSGKPDVDADQERNS